MTDAEKAAFKANAERLTRQIEESGAKSIVNMMKPELADCDPDAASLTLAFPGQPWECNPTGAVHGGLVATMFDTAMGMASCAVTGELTPTMSLTTS